MKASESNTAVLKRRQDQADKQWFRTDRVYKGDDGEGWYFHTREGVNIGPYESQFEAEIEASMIKELLKELDPDASPILVIREFVLDSFSMGRRLQPTFARDQALLA